MGPLLFSIYVNPLTSILLSQGSFLIPYADDIFLYRPILSPCDIDTLQEDNDKIANWIRSAGLCLSVTKSKAVVFCRKKSRPIVNVTVDNCAVPDVDSTRFLGVTVTSDLQWNTHIDSTCARARQQLGVIHRSFYEANPGTLSYLYRCLVVPTLDYCSSVWDPHTTFLINKLESVQRLAVRLITKRWSASPSYLLRSLNLCPLQERRWKQKAMVCARIIKGCSIIPPSYFTPHPHPSRRHHHSSPLITLFARTTAHQSSFLSAVLAFGTVYLITSFVLSLLTPLNLDSKFSHFLMSYNYLFQNLIVVMNVL